MTKEELAQALNELAADANDNAVRKGFWDGHWRETNRNAYLCQKLLLISSEVIEAMDNLRQREAPEGFTEELADIIVRTLDLAEHFAPGAIGKALVDKMDRNRARPKKHGKVF